MMNGQDTLAVWGSVGKCTFFKVSVGLFYEPATLLLYFRLLF